MPHPSKRRLTLAALLLAIAAALVLALTQAGRALVLDDPPAPASAVVVLGGQVPFRALEAAAVYKHGDAPQVWLTQGGIFREDQVLAQLGIERPPEHIYSQWVLERSGVPSSAIR